MLWCTGQNRPLFYAEEAVYALILPGDSVVGVGLKIMILPLHYLTYQSTSFLFNRLGSVELCNNRRSQLDQVSKRQIRL